MHTAVAVQADGTMAQAVQSGVMSDDWQTGTLREEARAVFPFLEKLTLSPDEVGPEDVQALREAGLSDEAIRDAIYVCTVFNVIDRIADAFDFDLPTQENIPKLARFLVRMGY